MLAAILIRFTDQPLLFLFREALYNAFTRLNPLDSKGFFALPLRRISSGRK